MLSESAAGWSTLVTLALAGSAGFEEELVKAAVDEAFSAAAAAAAAAALASRSSFFFCVICAYVFVGPSYLKINIFKNIRCDGVFKRNSLLTKLTCLPPDD